MAEARPGPANVFPAMIFKQTDNLRQAHRNLKAQGAQLPIGITDRRQLIRYVMSHNFLSSTAPVDWLEKVPFSALRRDDMAKCKYVLVRVIEDGYGKVAWNTVIEDEYGNTCALEVFNYPRKELFGPGTILLIKEPYTSVTSTGFPYIRCDSPSDITVFKRSHRPSALVKDIKWTHKTNIDEDFVSTQSSDLTAEEWLHRGENYFEDGNVQLALECYLLGLQNCTRFVDLEWKLLLERLSQLYLYLGHYERAIRIAKRIPNDKLAQRYLEQAYYELKKYGVTHVWLHEFLRNCQTDPRALSWYRRSNPATEPNKELIDAVNPRPEILVFADILDSMKKFDHFNHMAPIWIVVKDGLYGVKLARTVPSNTVLIISKALGSSFNPDRGIVEVLAGTVQAVYRNPKTIGQMIYDLSSDGQPKVDVDPSEDDCVTKVEKFCDVDRIKTVCQNRVIAITHNGMEVGDGFFLVPSFMKHSCQPNVECSFVNDVMTVYSTKDMACEEELYMNYTGIKITTPYKLRKSAYEKRRLTCNCSSCKTHTVFQTPQKNSSYRF